MATFKIGDALKQMVQENTKLKNGIRAAQIETVWEEIMGITVAKYTDKIYIFDQKLFIHFGSNNITKIPNTTNLKSLIGSKGAALYEMSKLGINIPLGFSISTQLCQEYYKNNKTLPQNFDIELQQNLSLLQKSTVQEYFILSVRSGAADSMPGMMDTILNIGINDNIINIAKSQKQNIIF